MRVSAGTSNRRAVQQSLLVRTRGNRCLTEKGQLVVDRARRQQSTALIYLHFRSWHG